MNKCYSLTIFLLYDLHSSYQVLVSSCKFNLVYLHLFLACSTSVPQLSSYRHSCVPSWIIIAPGITGLCTNQRKMSYMCRWQTGGFSSWSKYSRTKKEGEQMLCKKLNHVKNVQYNRFVQNYGDEGMVVLKENFGTILNISDCFPEQ